ncbi:MAG: tetratricopeptide repeat protein [Myxococcota bacterium]
MAEGDFYRAIGEYKRYLFLTPEGPHADAARHAIGLSYLRGGQPDAALAHYQSLLATTWARPDSTALAAQAALQVGYAHYLGGDNPAAATHLAGWLATYGQSVRKPQRERAGYLLGWAQLTLGQYQPAADRFATLSPFPGQGALVEAARSLTGVPTKSPLLAGLFSLVPGGGHLYLGQPLIGLAALTWNGLFGFATFDAARRGDLGVALVLGVLEALWYFGTLFGAVSGAYKYNRDARLNALEDLRARFDDRPESWPPAPPLTGR